MKWIWLSLLGAAGAGASTGTAWGAEPPPAATASAPAGSQAPVSDATVTDEAARETAGIDAALRDADRHFVDGDLVGALGVLGPACSTSQRPDCAFSLGAIEHGLGHCAQALGYYRKYRELAPEGEHISEVTAALQEVESRCGDASVTTGASTPVAGALAGAVSAQPGPSVAAQPAASSSDAAALAEPRATLPRPHTELMWGAFALSGAAALSSVVFGVLAAQSAHDCAQPRVYDQEFIEECEEQGPTYQTLWQGFAVASGGFLGIGLTLWWLDANAAASVAVSAAGSPTLKVQGRF